jgi:hypothetical protein
MQQVGREWQGLQQEYSGHPCSEQELCPKKQFDTGLQPVAQGDQQVVITPMIGYLVFDFFLARRSHDSKIWL